MSISLMKQIESLYSGGATVGLTDGQLLEHFVNRQDESAAEAAFAVLVDRHGPMVLRVCRRTLRDEHAAQDASQAVFLILARRSTAITYRESISSWLYGVAMRVAAKARVAASRRRKHERRGGEIAADRRSEPPGGTECDGERWAELLEELARLPEAFRAPIILCYLEGQTQERAAAHLRWKLGTVQSRLARGRARLKSRLARRGIAPALGLLRPMAAPQLPLTPAAWSESTVRLAMLWSTKGGAVAAGQVPVAAALAEEVLRATIVHKLKIALSLVLIFTASGAGAWAWAGSHPIPFGLAQTDKPAGPGAAITGWVAGPDGKPLAGAKLESPFLKIREKTVTTGTDGRFTITAEQLPSSEFALRIDAPDLASKMFTIVTAPLRMTTPPLGPVPTVYLMEPTGMIGQALAMDRGSVVTGRIIREGRAVPGTTVGFWRDFHKYDVALGSPEVRTDAKGRFRFPHAPADAAGWVYVSTGSLERAGAVVPRSLQTPAADLSVDLGDIEVRPGRTISGRVVFADGRHLPFNAEVLVSADHAAGWPRTRLDRLGRFTLSGLPEGQIDLVAYFPDDKSYAPAGYHVSTKNKCLDPLNPWWLVGQLARVMSDRTLLFEPGEQPPPSHAPDRLAAFKEAQAGPITGVPPHHE